MNLHVTISTPLYLDKMVAKQNVKKSDLPKKNLKVKNTNKPRNNAKGEKIHKVVYTIPAEHVSGPRQSKVKYVSGDKTKREMRIENRRKRKSVLQTYQQPYDAKAQNLKQLVAELESSDNDAHNAYKAMFDTMCWVSEMKEYEAHQQQIEQVKENIRLSLKAYEYTKAGKEKDEQDAKVLRKKNVSSQIKESSDDDIKNCLAEISVACKNRFLLHSRVKILLADCKKYNIR